MRKCVLLVCILVLTNGVRGQTTNGLLVDSLVQLLQHTTSYNTKLEVLGLLANEYSYSDSASSLKYAHQMKKLAEEEKDERGRGLAYYRIGGAYLEAYQFDKAKELYKLAAEILEKDTSYLGQSTLGKVWFNYGLAYQREGDLHTQLEYLIEKTIPINEQLKDTLSLGKDYHNIGLIFKNIKEYEKALQYFQKSSLMLENYAYVPELKDNLVRIAETMLYLDVDDHLRDSAFSILQRAKVLLDQYPDMMSEILYLQAMGMCHEYFDLSLTQADSYYKKASDLAEKSKMIPMLTGLNIRRFYIKDKQEDFAAGLKLLENNYHNYAEYLTLRDQLLHVRHMMRMQENLGNTTAALELHKKYNILSDSVHASEMSLKIQELEQKYAAKEKETQIIKLNQVAQEQQMQIERNRQWVYLLIVAILFLVGFFFARQNINRKKNQIARQQAELLEQRIEKMKQEQHISHFAAVLEGQEQERKRLAIDLHDGLGGALSGIRLKLSRVIRDGATQTVNEDNSALKNIAGELDHSINDLRHIARNMMPESLLKYGLIEAIKDFCRSMETEKNRISFQAFDVEETRMSQAVQIMVFRIFQELITNTIKHAKATNILAQFLQQQHTVSITVEDDGVGFDTGAAFEGIGLTTLKNRVSFLGGKLDIHAEKGVGTTTNIEFDIKDEPE